jgi:Flp pilus assembly protein TadG
MQPHRKSGRTGNSLVEVTLLAPWLFFLFVGVLDFGFYSYAFISTENAARAAALLTSRSSAAATDQAGACRIVKSELQWAAYGRTFSPTCDAPPLQVTAAMASGPDDAPAAQVTVVYRTMTMIPIPGVLAKQFDITRTVQMKVDPVSQ